MKQATDNRYTRHVCTCKSPWGQALCGDLLVVVDLLSFF